nr:BTAD domain-containing putative transcriptional regulator [uncultured Actinoplanes sp.]
MDTMWPGAPPRSAINVIHRSVGALRRLLEPDLPARSPGRWILRHGQGYRLAVDGANLDLVRFRLEHARARGVVPIGDGEALNSYLAALETWRGPCLADLDLPATTEPAAVAVNAEVSTVACEAADLALRIGRPGSLLTHLRRICEVDRYNESLHARLMHCLVADGHHAESLAVYDGLRIRLADELGVKPGNQLTDAYARARGYRGAVAGGHLNDRTTISSPPAQLPADVPGYVGRCRELARLTELADAAEGDPDALLTVVITGMPGVGKSALAVHWGHQMSPRFPDGQLFLNLCGFDPHGEAMSTSSALRALLSALGVARQDIPAEPDAQAGLYRSLVAHRRMLIVLDNARDAHQVRDLLPGSPGCAAVITSRHRLHRLAVSGAEVVRLGLPDPDQARSTLVSRLGMGHATSDPAAATEIVERCGRLPLALAIVAARVVANPGFALSAIADELAAAPHRLDCFDNGDDDCDLRTAFSWSVDQLPQPAQRLFRLLALHGGGSFSATTAATIAGCSLHTTRHLLQVLAGSCLLMEQEPGRFAFHDLLRAYATELVMEHEPECERQAALRRLSQSLPAHQSPHPPMVPAQHPTGRTGPASVRGDDGVGRRLRLGQARARHRA